jgi:hypothetical protein
MTNFQVPDSVRRQAAVAPPARPPSDPPPAAKDDGEMDLSDGWLKRMIVADPAWPEIEKRSEEAERERRSRTQRDPRLAHVEENERLRAMIDGEPDFVLPSGLREQLEQPKPKPVPSPTQQEAAAATEMAVEAVEHNADPEWLERAFQAVQICARDNAHFTVDRVWDYIEKPREPRALGPVMRRAMSAQVIASTGEYDKSDRRHSSPVMIYKSLLFREEQGGLF